MSSQESSPSNGSSSHRQGIFIGVALVAILVLMVASYFYPNPSGKRPDLLDLLMLWWREAIIVVFALVLLVALTIRSVVNLLNKRGQNG